MAEVSQEETASDIAIARFGVASRTEHTNYAWLQRELEAHREEYDRLCQQHAALLAENSTMRPRTACPAWRAQALVLEKYRRYAKEDVACRRPSADVDGMEVDDELDDHEEEGGFRGTNGAGARHAQAWEGSMFGTQAWENEVVLSSDSEGSNHMPPARGFRAE